MVLLKDYHIPHALPNATASDLRNKAPHVTEEGILSAEITACSPPSITP